MGAVITDGSLSDDQIQEIVAYLESFSRKADVRKSRCNPGLMSR